MFISIVRDPSASAQRKSRRESLGHAELGAGHTVKLNIGTHELPRGLLKPLHQADHRKASSYRVGKYHTSHNSLTSTVSAFVRLK